MKFPTKHVENMLKQLFVATLPREIQTIENGTDSAEIKTKS